MTRYLLSCVAVLGTLFCVVSFLLGKRSSEVGGVLLFWLFCCDRKLLTLASCLENFLIIGVHIMCHCEGQVDAYIIWLLDKNTKHESSSLLQIITRHVFDSKRRSSNVLLENHILFIYLSTYLLDSL